MNNIDSSRKRIQLFKNSFYENHKFTFFALFNFAVLAILKEAYVFVLFAILVFLGIKNSKKYLPFSLLFLSIMGFFNPFFGQLPSPFWNLALVLFSAMFILKKKFHFNRLENLFFLVLLLFVLTSLLVSPFPSIAIVKAISLIVFSYAVFKTYKWGYINESILRQFIEALVIGNLVLYYTPYGYYINGLFMGVFNHSQSIGIFFVPLLVYYTISFFEKQIRGKWEKLFSIFMILLGFIEILATYSRTSIFTYVALIIMYVVLKKFNLKNIVMIFKKPFHLFVAIIILGIISLNVSKIYNVAQNYIFKSYSNAVWEVKGTGNILSSRQALFDESINNFYRSPILGNGFGVQFENGQVADNPMKYLPLLNVPYTMVNEKGNVYLMVLEEGGIIVFIVFLWFVLLQLKQTKRFPPAFYTSFSIFIVFNGESTFFSLNGAGAYQFIFLIMMYFLAREVSITKEMK